MLSLPPIPETSPPKPVPFWVLQEKQLQMIHPRTSLLLGWTNIYPAVSGGTWIHPYWEEISSCLQTLAAIAILIEDAHVYLWRIYFDTIPPHKTMPDSPVTTLGTLRTESEMERKPEVPASIGLLRRPATQGRLCLSPRSVREAQCDQFLPGKAAFSLPNIQVIWVIP